MTVTRMETVYDVVKESAPQQAEVQHSTAGYQ